MIPSNSDWTASHRREAYRQRLREILIGLGLALIAAMLMLAGFPAPSHAAACTRGNDGRWQDCTVRHLHRQGRGIDANGNAIVIGSRPSDCPYAYCGCGLRKYLGLADRRLNLADNWRRLFPHTYPHAGAVAVRRAHWRGHGHVMLLISRVEGSIWRVRDYNGGRHLSYIHDRSVAGYVFVDPGVSRLAALDP